MNCQNLRFATNQMTMPQDTDQPLAISYLRFSTPEQEQGDSFRRQTKAADDYAARHGLYLRDDLRFADRGISAFRGANGASGALAAIARAAEDGSLPKGTYLLVENLDRLSRQDPFDASYQLQTLVRAGLIVVTLTDGAVFSRESLSGLDGVMRIFGSLMVMSRAFEESETKSRRLGAAWEAKRADAAANGTRLTKLSPAWLKAVGKAVGRARWVVVEEKADLVRRIFGLYRDGVGKDGIAKLLNKEGVSPLGRGGQWHPSAAQKLLDNSAVIGTCTPHRTLIVEGRKKREPLEPIPGYFPPVIDQQLWDDVRARRRAVKPRGVSAQHPIQSVLAGIAKCPRCGGSMTRVQKGNRSTPKLVCSAAKNGKGCEYVSTDYAALEHALRTSGLAAVATAPLGDQTVDLERDLEGLEAAIDETTGQLERGVRLETDHGSTPALRHARREGEGRLQALLDERRDLEARIVEASPMAVRARMGALERVLARGSEDGEAPATPKEVSEALQRTCDAVIVDDVSQRLELHWRHGGVSSLVFGFPKAR